VIVLVRATRNSKEMEVGINALRCSDADRTREINLIETRLNTRLRRTIVKHFVSTIDDPDSKSEEMLIAEERKGRKEAQRVMRGNRNSP